MSDDQNDSPTPEKRRQGQHMTDAQRGRAQTKFLKAFAENANTLLSARAAHVNRSTVYDWLEKDEQFSILYHQAEIDANDTLEAEIDRRGRVGWQEPVYQLGYLAGYVQKYSDTLLIFLAKKRIPAYREKSQIDVTANVTTQTAGTIALDMRNATQEELQQLKALALAMKERGQ